MARLRSSLLVALVTTCALVTAPPATHAEPDPTVVRAAAAATPNPRLLSTTLLFPFPTSTSSAVMGGQAYLPGCQWPKPIRCGLFRTDGTSAPSAVRTHAGPVEGVEVVGATAQRVFYSVRYDMRVDAELWASDGTEAGTQLILGAAPQAFQVVGDEVVFHAHGTGGWYRSDGSAAGTRPMPDPASPWTDEPYVDRAFLDGAKVAWISGDSLKVSDGTRAGTRLLDPDLARFAGVDDYFFYEPGPWVGGVNVFAVEREIDEATGERRRELWRTDGTSAGTWHVGNVATGWPREVVAHEGRFFYVAADQLWSTDGTPGETRRVAVPAVVSGAKVTSVGLPTTMDGRVGVPIRLKARGRGWREAGKAAAIGTLTREAVTSIGPVLPVDPGRGTWLGSRLVLENDELDLLDGSNTVRWWVYDASRRVAGQPSRVHVRVPKAVRAGATVRVSVGVASRLLPYSPTARVVIKHGKRTLASRRINRNHLVTMSFPADRLGKGRATIRVQYLGDWRVASSPVKRRTIRVT